MVSAALGVLFGAAEVTTVAFADEQGHQAWAGGLLALWALGSLTSGVVTGAIAWRRGPDRAGSAGARSAMAATMAPLALIDSVPVMGVALLVGGFAIAPTLVATLSLTERDVPAGRLTEGMAIMQTGLVAGVAPGATASGFVIDHHGRVGGVPRLPGRRTGRGGLRPGPAPRGSSLTAVAALTGGRDWTNWSGLEWARPAGVEFPRDVGGRRGRRPTGARRWARP